MLKIKLCYDLPEFDSDKHDPDKTFAFLTYRGVHYAKVGMSEENRNFQLEGNTLRGLSTLSFFVVMLQFYKC